jgi:methylglyoxal synthase
MPCSSHPLSALPHDVDVKALTHLSTYSIPMACNPATADYIISNRLFVSRP